MLVFENVRHTITVPVTFYGVPTQIAAQSVFGCVGDPVGVEISLAVGNEVLVHKRRVHILDDIWNGIPVGIVEGSTLERLKINALERALGELSGCGGWCGSAAIAGTCWCCWCCWCWCRCNGDTGRSRR